MGGGEGRGERRGEGEGEGEGECERKRELYSFPPALIYLWPLLSRACLIIGRLRQAITIDSSTSANIR